MRSSTPLERRLDRHGRPYFLWDLDWTEKRFRRELAEADDALRVELVAKLMRQAKPDDVFEYVSLDDVRRLWERLVPRLGQQRGFWAWLVERWGALVMSTPAPSALVSDPTVTMATQRVQADGTSVLVDSPQEILTNKLCALLSRSEVRDLVDTRWLLDHGADLERALRDAQAKDGGFSVTVLAWVLQGSDLDAMGRAAGVGADEVEELRRWRDGFVEQLIAMSVP